MNDESKEIVNSPNGTETTENFEAEVELDLPDPQEEVEKLRKDIESLKAQKEKWKQKASQPRAETEATDISTTDLYSLVDAKVAMDDVPEVKDYAKLKGMTVTDALKTTFIKTLLRDRDEQRRVAQAANVANSRRNSAKLSDDALLNRAHKGELPEDEEEIARIIRLRRDSQRPNRERK